MFTTTDFETMRMNEIAMSNSRMTYMLVDSSKFSSSSHVAYAPIDRIHTIVTDDDVSDMTLKKLKESNANIVCVTVK